MSNMPLMAGGDTVKDHMWLKHADIDDICNSHGKDTDITTHM